MNKCGTYTTSRDYMYIPFQIFIILPQFTILLLLTVAVSCHYLDFDLIRYSKSIQVGYIIGLGDRHTENIMYDSRNGDTVHVDMNCLFNKVARTSIVFNNIA